MSTGISYKISENRRFNSFVGHIWLYEWLTSLLLRLCGCLILLLDDLFRNLQISNITYENRESANLSLRQGSANSLR